MARCKLSPPWIIFYREVSAMFELDPEVHVVYDEDLDDIKLYVENPVKVAALGELMPAVVEFGNHKVSITIIPSNCDISLIPDVVGNPVGLIRDALTGNGAFCWAKAVYLYSNPIIYVVFKNKVVQYFNDDLSDAHGVCSTLYQEIAKNIFKELPGVYYCTELADPNEYHLHMPLGEWP